MCVVQNTCGIRDHALRMSITHFEQYQQALCVLHVLSSLILEIIVKSGQAECNW